jgi:hypothetical protein
VTWFISNTISAAKSDTAQWLTRLLGDRPADVAGAVTYDDTVHTIAAWRALHDLPPAVQGFGPRPEHESHQWDDLTARLATTRQWLATSHRLTPDIPAIRTERELLDRLTEVDAILDTAPPDWQPLIAQLRAGQLALDGTDEVLADALAGQDARRCWILEHWPHVVEYHEVGAALKELSTAVTDYPRRAGAVLGPLESDDLEGRPGSVNSLDRGL